MPLNISLFVQLLWGFPKSFFLLGRTLTSKWGFRPNTEAQASTPPHLQLGLLSFCQFDPYILITFNLVQLIFNILSPKLFFFFISVAELIFVSIGVTSW